MNMLASIKFIYSSVIFISGGLVTYFIIKPFKNTTMNSLMEVFAELYNKNAKELPLDIKNTLHKSITKNANNLNTNKQLDHILELFLNLFEYDNIKNMLIIITSLSIIYTIIYYLTNFSVITNYLISIFNPIDFYYKRGYYAQELNIEDKIKELVLEVESLTKAVNHQRQSFESLNNQILKQNNIIDEVRNQVFICTKTSTKLLEKTIEYNSELIEVCNKNINKNAERLKLVFNLNKKMNQKLIILNDSLYNLTEYKLINRQEKDSYEELIEDDLVSENVSLNLTNRVKDLSYNVDNYLKELELNSSHQSLFRNEDQLVNNYKINSFDFFKYKYGINPVYINRIDVTDRGNNFIFNYLYRKNNKNTDNSNELKNSIVYFEQYKQLPIKEKSLVLISSFFHTNLDALLNSKYLNNYYLNKYILKYLYN